MKEAVGDTLATPSRSLKHTVHTRPERCSAAPGGPTAWPQGLPPLLEPCAQLQSKPDFILLDPPSFSHQILKDLVSQIGEWMHMDEGRTGLAGHAGDQDCHK